MSVGVFYLLAAVVWFVSFALLCGNLRRTLITAVYCCAAASFIDIIFLFAEFTLGGTDDWQAMLIAGMAHLSPVLEPEFLLFTVKHSLGLVWAVFYYRIARRYPVNLPLRSWLLTVLPPVITVCALLFFWSAALKMLDAGTNIFGLGLGMAIFLFLLNCFLFYWHIINLLATRQAEETLKKLRNEAPAEAPAEQKPPDTGTPVRVWTPQAGFAGAFAVKYKLSRREKQALELVLAGKSDKEIATEMGITSPTASVYLHRVYKKTGVSGRFDLLTFVHTGGAQNTGQKF
jgi:DNA-binding CsgD family transcriptional regulator